MEFRTKFCRYDDEHKQIMFTTTARYLNYFHGNALSDMDYNYPSRIHYINHR